MRLFLFPERVNTKGSDVTEGRKKRTRVAKITTSDETITRVGFAKLRTVKKTFIVRQNLGGACEMKPVRSRSIGIVSTTWNGIPWTEFGRNEPRVCLHSSPTIMGGSNSLLAVTLAYSARVYSTRTFRYSKPPRGEA